MGNTGGPTLASMAGVGLSAYGQVLKGEGEQAGAEYRAQRLERQAQIGKVAATQTNVQGLEELNTTLGNIDAIRAAAHTDPTSPTGAALRDRAEYLGYRGTNIAVANILEQTKQQEADAQYLRTAGKYALLGGRIGAAATILGAAGSTSMGTFGLPSGGGGDSDLASMSKAASAAAAA